MVTPQLHIIMPVKDSWETTRAAIQTILNNGYTLTVYDDYSLPENAASLATFAQQAGFELIPLQQLTDHPSPNYHTVLIHARQQALQLHQDLCIIESDVFIQPHTLPRMVQAVSDGVGMVAAITINEQGQVNYPYSENRKHFSFCCTILTQSLLQALDLEQALDPTKNWYDVTISHLCDEKGLQRILQTDNTVLHRPHSSRPWKQLKYQHPFRYYWNKFIHHQDKI